MIQQDLDFASTNVFREQIEAIFGNGSAGGEDSDYFVNCDQANSSGVRVWNDLRKNLSSDFESMLLHML